VTAIRTGAGLVMIDTGSGETAHETLAAIPPHAQRGERVARAKQREAERRAGSFATSKRSPHPASR